MPFDSWLHSYELAGDRIWKEYVTYVQPPAKKGRTPRNTEVSARDKRIVQQIKEASWKDNKFARASGENSIRMAERIYIDGIDLAELDIGNEVDFYGKALYRVGVFRFRGVEYSRFTLSKTEAEQELMKLNGVKP